MSTDFDWSFHKRAQESIAQNALTNSKRVESLIKGVFPTHVRSGSGCHLTDMKGKTYIDFICGLGANILGYGNAEVSNVISAQASLGCSFSLSSELELLVAEKVKELFPFVDKMKFLKSGSEACSAALRIARAVTGRVHVLSEGYHGWHDSFVALTEPNSGVPFHPTMSKLKSFEDISTFHAAVIVEPIMTDISRERCEWLQELRKICTQKGVMLIFDEVITGFRTPRFSMSYMVGVTPDLICLGKAMANGMPIAVVAGKKDVMDHETYFVSSTFAGETLSLAAALKTMTLLQTKYSLELLWERGEKFLASFNTIWPEGLIIKGYPSRGVLSGDPKTRALFMQEACIAGILFGPSWFLNFSHFDVLDAVLNTSQDILGRIRRGEVALKGEMPTSPFAQRVRESSL